MSGKTELRPPDTKLFVRHRSASPGRQASLTVFERRRMFEQDKERDRGSYGERDLLLPPGRADQTDFSGEKTSGKRRHTMKERSSVRGGSFRASKKARQELNVGDVGGGGGGGGGGSGSGSPQFRHKQQSSLSSIPVPPLWMRLRNFGHHDLQSATLERLGSERGGGRDDHHRAMRKKATGASAAHIQMELESSMDARENDIVAACPAFRNELGGHGDWAGEEDADNPLLAIRGSLSHDKQKRVGSRAKMLLEGTIPSKEIMQHKSPMSRHVLQILQPQTSMQFPFEYIDYGALYYRNHFYQQGEGGEGGKEGGRVCIFLSW